MNQRIKLPEVLNLHEAARFLRLPKTTVRELAVERRIPGQQVKREWRFLKAALEEWLRGSQLMTPRDLFLSQAGAFKDDPALTEIAKQAIRERGRPNPDEVGY